MIINPLLAAAIAVPATGVFVKYMNNKNKTSEINYPSFDTSSISAEPSLEPSLTTTYPEEPSLESSSTLTPTPTSTYPEEPSLESSSTPTEEPYENANIKVGGKRKSKKRRKNKKKGKKSKKRKSKKNK